MDWNSLVTRYGDRVLLVCRNILREDGLSRDAAQEALLKLSTSNGEVRDWDAWVLTVAGNAARDVLRRVKRAPGPLEEDRVDTATKGPMETVLARESAERLRSAMVALAAPDRDVLLLKFREGLSGPDIAKALGISLESAWQKVSRALKALRAKMGEGHE